MATWSHILFLILEIFFKFKHMVLCSTILDIKYNYNKFLGKGTKLVFILKYLKNSLKCDSVIGMTSVVECCFCESHQMGASRSTARLDYSSGMFNVTNGLNSSFHFTYLGHSAPNILFLLVAF